MKYKMQLLAALAMMAMVTFNTGCSHTKMIGRIGDLEVHKVSIRGLDSPNITALATRNVQSNEVNFVETASGAGIGPALVAAAGGAGASALNGVSLRPSNTRISNNTAGGYSTTGNLSSGSTSGGGNANAMGGTGGTANGGNGYGSAGATSSSGSQSGSYSQSDSWSGVIGSGNALQNNQQSVCSHGSGCGVCR